MNLIIRLYSIKRPSSLLFPSPTSIAGEFQLRRSYSFEYNIPPKLFNRLIVKFISYFTSGLNSEIATDESMKLQIHLKFVTPSYNL
jgi:hypothetical protein